MKAHHGKRFLSFLLVLCMIAAVAPLTLAADSALGAIQEANAENNFDYEYSTKTLAASGAGGTVTIAFNEPSGGLSSRDYYAAVIPSSSTSADDVRYGVPDGNERRTLQRLLARRIYQLYRHAGAVRDERRDCGDQHIAGLHLAGVRRYPNVYARIRNDAGYVHDSGGNRRYL